MSAIQLSQRLDSLYNKKTSNREKNFKNIEILETLTVENFKGKKKPQKKKLKNKSKYLKLAEDVFTLDNKGDKFNRNTFLQKLGFRPVTFRSMLSFKGWHDIFKILFFFFPALILFIAKKIVDIDILRNKEHDPSDKAKYNAFKEKDTNWIYNSGIEFFQIFISAYLASALYTNIYIEQQGDIETYLTTSFQYINVFLLDYVFLFLLFLPKGFHFLIYDVMFKVETPIVVDDTKSLGLLGNLGGIGDLGNKLGMGDLGNKLGMGDLGNKLGMGDLGNKLGGMGDLENASKLAGSAMTNILGKLQSGGNLGDPTQGTVDTSPDRTLRYLMFYMIAFGICSFFLKGIADMFLEMFLFKANPSMYVFIILGFITWVIGIATGMKMDIKISEKTSWSVPNPIGIFKVYNMASLSYMIYLLLHVVISLTLAPIAQGTFSVYLFFFLSGGSNFFGNTFGNIFTYTESQISKELREKHERQQEQPFKLPDTLWDKMLALISTFDHFLYLFIFRTNEMMFTFILMIFFFYKILVTFIPPFNLNIFWLKTFFGIVNVMAFLVFSYLYYLLVKPKFD